MESGLRQHRFASQERFCNVISQVYSPPVMAIRTIAESYNKSSIGYALHLREYPLREERSAGPLIVPA